jgi:NADH-quinone oxidoreductase subunit H
MRFAYYYLAEYANIWVMSAIATTLFLGGWQIPGVSPQTILSAKGGAHVGFELLGLVIFAGKTIVLSNIVIWLRWTLPRIRVDQMMNLCWKYFVPMGMVLVMLTAINEWVLSGVPENMLSAAHFVFFAFGGVYLTYRFIKRTFWNLKVANEPIDLTNW